MCFSGPRVIPRIQRFRLSCRDQRVLLSSSDHAEKPADPADQTAETAEIFIRRDRRRLLFLLFLFSKSNRGDFFRRTSARDAGAARRVRPLLAVRRSPAVI